MSVRPDGPSSLVFPLGPFFFFSFFYLELNVVADELVALHELLLVAPVLRDHWEGVVDGGAQDAHQRLDARVWVDVRQVGLHDVTGSQPAQDKAITASKRHRHQGQAGLGSAASPSPPGSLGPVF